MSQQQHALDDDGYAAVTAAEQVALLRGAAHDGALAFGIEPLRLELARHAFNTTFLAEAADGRRVAVRVNTNSMSTPAHITAQHAWMRSLADETDLRLPVPLRTAAGADVVLVPFMGRDLPVVVASWLEGDEVGDCDTVQAAALGTAMASMHAHARGWSIPAGGHLSAFTEPLLGDEDRLHDAYRHRPQDLAVVEWALRRCRTAMSAAERLDRAVVVHGDLHGANLLWQDGGLAVLDFDDCGVATPAFDLAVATFYLRGADPQVEAALRAGYGEVGELPVAEDALDFEALVAARQLLLANDLLASRTAELREMALPYLDRTVERLSRWRESGRFTL